LGLAALVAPLVGLGGEDTALPMAAAVIASACVACLGGLLLSRDDLDPRGDAPAETFDPSPSRWAIDVPRRR
jgi:DHA1 family bicyclomycin/chloramphenicol resistance-like MFS transporter